MFKSGHFFAKLVSTVKKRNQFCNFGTNFVKKNINYSSIGPICKNKILRLNIGTKSVLEIFQYMELKMQLPLILYIYIYSA